MAAWVQTQVSSLLTNTSVLSSLTTGSFLHTFTSGNSLGIQVVVFDGANGLASFACTGCTDNLGNSYPLLQTVHASSSIVGFILGSQVPAIGVPTSLTFTFSGFGASRQWFAWVSADEISGVAGVENSALNYNSVATTTPTSGSITAAIGDLLLGMTVPNTSSTVVSVGSSYTLRDNDTTNTIYTETRVSPGGSNAATFGFAPADKAPVGIIAFKPFVSAGSETTDVLPRRWPRRNPLVQQDDTIQPVTRFQTFTPPIGFDEDRGEQNRRTAWRAHTQPIQDDWIQKQTRFLTFSPPIGFDEDRGIQARRVAWRAHPQPDYPEQLAPTVFVALGFDEDRGIQTRRSPWRAHSDVLVPGDFLSPTIFVPLGFDEDRGIQARRVPWRQHIQAVTDDWLLAPTVFVNLGFDEDRGRQQRLPRIAHQQPEDLQPPSAPPIWFDEEQHFQVRRQQSRSGIAHPQPQPQEDWLAPLPVVSGNMIRRRSGIAFVTRRFFFTTGVFVSWGFEEEPHFQVRRTAWRAHTQPIQDDWIQKETQFQTFSPPIGFDEDRGEQNRRVAWRAHPQPGYPEQLAPVTFVALGFDEDRGEQNRRVAWRARPGTRPDDSETFLPPALPPVVVATGNVIFGVIRNLF